MSEQEFVALVRSSSREAHRDRDDGGVPGVCGILPRVCPHCLGTDRRSHRGWIDADDFVQLVLMSLTHRVKTSRFDGVHVTLEVCIAKIAHDIVLRHTHRFSRHRAEPLTPDVAAEILDPEEGPETQLEQCNYTRTTRLLASLRGSLSERDYRIATKRCLDDRSVTEIADELGLTEDCVTSVLHRVNPKLRERLRSRGWAPSIARL